MSDAEELAAIRQRDELCQEWGGGTKSSEDRHFLLGLVDLLTAALAETWEAATGEPWGGLTEEDCEAEGEWCGDLYRSVAPLLALRGGSSLPGREGEAEKS